MNGLFKKSERTPNFWTNPFPFLFPRRGILWLCALRKARMPSGEAARQPFPKTAKVPIGGPGGSRTPYLLTASQTFNQVNFGPKKALV